MAELKKYHLLLVDDNPVNLELLQELIAAHLPQCRTTLAESGARALELAQELQFDGAFIDMQMPGMDGIEVCRRLKASAQTEGIPVVLITAHQSTAELRAEGLDVGAYDFISQPIRNVELVARIKVLLRIKDVEEKLLKDNQWLETQDQQKSVALRWVAGLMAEFGDNNPSSNPNELDQLATLLGSDGELNFAGFTGEVFGRFPLSIRRILGLLSLLDEIPVSLAEKLTGSESIRGVLDFFERQNFFVHFTPETDTYQFVNPLKNYLETQSRLVLGDNDRRALYLEAADWWLEHRHPGKAVELLVRAGEFQSAERVVLQVGPSLFGDGFLRGLVCHHAKIVRQGLPSTPWLHAVLAVAELETEPSQALTRLGEVRKVLAAQQDLPGVLFCASQEIKAHFLVDGDLQLIAELLQIVETIWSQIASACDPHIRIQAALFAALAHLLLGSGQQQADIYLEILLSSRELEQSREYLAWRRIIRGYEFLTAGKWRSGFRELEQLWGQEHSTDLATTTLLAGCLVKSLLLEIFDENLGRSELWTQVKSRVSRVVLQRTVLPLVEQLQKIQSCVSRGDWRAADDLFVELPVQSRQFSDHLRSLILEQKAQILTLAGQRDSALSAVQEAICLRGGQGGFYRLRNAVLMATVCYALGNKADVCRLLAEVGAEQAQCDDNLLSTMAQLLLVQSCPVAPEMNRDIVLDDLLQKLARHKLTNFPYWFRPVHSQLLVDELASKMERPQLNQITRKHLHARLQPDGRLVPLLEIRVLGEFYLSLNGFEVLYKKDLSNSFRQLLAMLISAPNQQLSQDEVQGVLWPESSTEKSRSKLDTLLLRLRKTLESVLGEQDAKSYIYLQRGVLCLDCCMVDATGFDELARQGLRHVRRMEYWQAELAFRKAFALWHGEFSLGIALDEKSDFFRQDLLLLYLDAAQRWVELLLMSGQTEIAAEVARQALQTDPTQDQLVRLSRKAYLSLGLNGQAHQVLKDYASALQQDGLDASEVRDVLASIDVSVDSRIERSFGSW